jgi:hypothetical protein
MFKKFREVYLVHEMPNGENLLCKVLNRYDNDEDATNDLKDLLSKKLTEKELLVEFTNKGI